jgi:5-methylcytosine-specific restriction endonuclease McrA
VQIPFRAAMPLTRRALLARDEHSCQVSGCTRSGTTVDHVIPRARGGKHRWENVVAMCAKHNFTKSDKLLSEIGWALKREPRMPHGTMWLFIAIGIEPEEAWLPYIGPQIAVA